MKRLEGKSTVATGAASGISRAPVHDELTADDWMAILKVNLIGAFGLSQSG